MKDKNQLPQIIVLGVLVAFCAGFVVFKMTGKKPSAAAPPARTEVAQAAPAAGSIGGPGTSRHPELVSGSDEMLNQVQHDDHPGKPDKVTVGDKTVVTVPASMDARPVKRDPFSPALSAETTIAAAPPQFRTPTVKIASSGTLPFIPTMGPLPYGAGAGAPGGSARMPTVETVQPQPFPAFDLTGIITGKANVAIIRVGETKYIVREGQYISGKYKVVTVSQDGVLISYDGRSVFLKLGGDGNER